MCIGTESAAAGETSDDDEGASELMGKRGVFCVWGLNGYVCFVDLPQVDPELVPKSTGGSRVTEESFAEWRAT